MKTFIRYSPLLLLGDRLGADGAAASRFLRRAADAVERDRILVRHDQGRRSRDQRRRLALPRRRGPRARDRDRRRRSASPWPGGSRSTCCSPDRGSVLSAAEIGAHPGHRDLARLRRRLQDPADLPRLHAAGDHRRLQRRALERPDVCCGRRAAWAPAACACCATWCCRAPCRNCSTASAPRWRSPSFCWSRPS